MDRPTCSPRFFLIFIVPVKRFAEANSLYETGGYLVTARNMPGGGGRERKHPALGISIFLLLSRPPFRCCFFRRYSLIAFPRVCPFLVTFLKLITSAPSASFVSFPSRWSVRVPTFTFSRLLQRFFRSSRQMASPLPSSFPLRFLPVRMLFSS